MSIDRRFLNGKKHKRIDRENSDKSAEAKKPPNIPNIFLSKLEAYFYLYRIILLKKAIKY